MAKKRNQENNVLLNGVFTTLFCIKRYIHFKGKNICMYAGFSANSISFNPFLHLPKNDKSIYY